MIRESWDIILSFNFLNPEPCPIDGGGTQHSEPKAATSEKYSIFL